MNITIVAPYCSLPNEPHFNRFWYLAELLSQSHDVLLITSNFKHYDKSFRRPEDAEAASQGRLKVKLMNESGYSKNVSLARLKSHDVFVKDFEQWLQSCRPGEQDVVFSAYPLIATNLLLGKHKARLGYKLIIDVQDVWPESFSAVLPVLKKIPHNLLPFAGRANAAYRAADALVAGVVAQLIPRKGHRYLLAALPGLLQRYPALQVLIFGQGPLEAELRAEVAKYGLADVVHFTGFRHDLARWIGGLDMLVHPADMEGLGVSLLQASAAGVPIITSRAGGLPEAVQDEVTGILCPPGDVPALTAAVARLAADPALRRRFGAAGRARILAEFSIDAMVAGNLAVYRQVLQP